MERVACEIKEAIAALAKALILAEEGHKNLEHYLSQALEHTNYAFNLTLLSKKHTKGGDQ